MCQTLSVTLGGAYDGGGAYPMALQSRELLQWVVVWQHERWRRKKEKEKKEGMEGERVSAMPYSIK